MREQINKVKKFGQFLNENINKEFTVGTCYEYNYLNNEIQKDIDIQFKKNNLEDDEDPDMDYPFYEQPLFDGDPDHYVYCYKYINEKEIMEIYPEVHIIGGQNSQYIDNTLIPNIKKNGLKNPPIGHEGNHRALAYLKMKKPMPYLEIIKK